MTTEMRSPTQVTRAWLDEILRNAGYTTKPGERDPEVIAATHPTRPNLSVKLHPELHLIVLVHFWGLKKGGFGSHKNLMEALNKANSVSWRDTFFIDQEGDLGVSSYITLADELSEATIADFLEQEAQGFQTAIIRSGLIEHVA